LEDEHPGVRNASAAPRAMFVPWQAPGRREPARVSGGAITAAGLSEAEQPRLAQHLPSSPAAGPALVARPERPDPPPRRRTAWQKAPDPGRYRFDCGGGWQATGERAALAGSCAMGAGGAAGPVIHHVGAYPSRRKRTPARAAHVVSGPVPPTWCTGAHWRCHAIEQRPRGYLSPITQMPSLSATGRRAGPAQQANRPGRAAAPRIEACLKRMGLLAFSP
jgi:hypothetical protein